MGESGASVALVSGHSGAMPRALFWSGRSLRELAKATMGGVTRGLNAQCRFDRAVFILAHMRCGSTALSNVLCSRPEISGYGEAHIAYRSSRDLGRLVVNQLLRNAWKPRADLLFDKVLHNRHDVDVPEAFFGARAIFLCRRPEDAIPSIRKLFTGLGRDEYTTDDEAASYYETRVNRLADLWKAFPPDRRIGLDFEMLTGNTEESLDRISGFLEFEPPLQNSYKSHAASVAGGGGDPNVSSKLDRIAPGPSRLDDGSQLDLKQSRLESVRKSYHRLRQHFDQTS